jgi:hypothetical protein
LMMTFFSIAWAGCWSRVGARKPRAKPMKRAVRSMGILLEFGTVERNTMLDVEFRAKRMETSPPSEPIGASRGCASMTFSR